MDIAAEIRKASTDALKMLIRNDARAVYEDALQGCYTMFMLEELHLAMIELLRRKATQITRDEVIQPCA